MLRGYEISSKNLGGPIHECQRCITDFFEQAEGIAMRINSISLLAEHQRKSTTHGLKTEKSLT
jgi:predicted nucleic acid-binding OB-fold protein